MVKFIITMKDYPITVLITDFDKTITVKDTIADIAYAATNNLDVGSDELVQSWHRVVEQFSREYIQLFERLLNQPQPTHDRYNALLQFFAAFDTVERASIERVVAGRFLAGLTRSQLQDIGRGIKKRARVIEILSNMRAAGIQINIISANWSTDLIIGAMGNLYGNIVANDFRFDATGRSTGQIDMLVVSPFDKLKYFRRLQSQTGKTLYIGDAVSDLLPILEADIGVLFGRDNSVMRVISHYNIPFRILTDEDKYSVDESQTQGTILIANSWEQLDGYLKRKT